MSQSRFTVYITIVLCFWTTVRSLANELAQLHPTELVSDPIQNSLGLELHEVAFGWSVSGPTENQIAYEILVASNPQKLAANVGDLWESGWRQSTRHTRIVYRGSALPSNSQIWWKVRIKTKDGNVSPFSNAVSFHTAKPRAENANPRLQTVRRRIVFLGNTLISGMDKYGYLETALTARWPHHDITFRNLGWPADDVFGTARSEFGSDHNTQSWEPPKGEVGFGYTVMLQQIQEARPSTIFVGYGSVAAFAEDDASFQRFTSGYKRLLTALEATGATIVLLSPPRQEFLGPPLPDPANRNMRLKRAAQTIQELAKKRGHGFVDLYENLIAENPQEHLTKNGVHLNELGYRRLADVIVHELGLENHAAEVVCQDDGKVSLVRHGTVKNVVSTNRGFRFDLTADALATNSPAVIKTVGDNAIKIDGQVRAHVDDLHWRNGYVVAKNPDDEQADELRRVIIAKNQLHRYRIRPLNKTYIFLFRRHEMGHLGYEREDLERLVEEKEELIARLRAPRTHRYELERLEPWTAPQDYSDHYVPDHIPPPDVVAEQNSFQVAEGFQVNLFAANPMIANPINLNWDRRGRAWVSTSSTYPHLKPGHQPNDRIIILEDTDHDGRADQSTVFADGLLIPHSVMPIEGGAYVCSATELLFLADRDGDDQADERHVVYSGFGNADVHHMIHGLRLAPWGDLYFLQSLYTNSFIETAWGNRRLNGGGVWRFQPTSEKLDIFVRGMVNPWGLTFDEWGQSFGTDGAYYEGPTYVFPGAAFETAVGAERILPGLVVGKPKYTSAEFISGRHMPGHWQGSLITNDFRGNRTVRYEIQEKGSGYSAREIETVLQSSHIAYRPVDVKMGPDGALYVVDWYNAILGHGEVDFYHPERDKSHGRIWRLTAKDRPTVSAPQISGTATADLLDMLKAPETWTRNQARRELAARGTSHRTIEQPGVSPNRSETVRISSDHILDWLTSIDPNDPRAEHHRLEALWLTRSVGVPNAELLDQVLSSTDPRARAAAVRITSHWFANLPDALSRLAKAVEDDHPRVRLEAVNALRQVNSLAAANVALRALDYPVDRDLDYAIWLTARATQDEWLPAIQSGETVFDGNIDRMTFALSAVRNRRAIKPLVNLIRQGIIQGSEREKATRTIAAMGNAQELGLLLNLTRDEVKLLPAIADGAATNQEVPEDTAPLVDLLEHEHAEIREAAIRLSGHWIIDAAKPRLLRILSGADFSSRDRFLAADALARLGEFATLEQLAVTDKPLPIRTAAICAWAGMDPAKSAPAAVALLTNLDSPPLATLVFEAFATRKEGPEILADAISGTQLSVETAMEGIRVAQASGRNLNTLINALTIAGSLEPVSNTLTADQRRDLLAQVIDIGDPTRGKAIFERKTMQCVTCHAIDNVGGKVGPDLTSVGGAMPAEALLESLLNPSSSIKQGYETVIVTRNSGSIVSGTMQRTTGDAILIRDQVGKVISIPNDDIESVDTSPISLMPQGLTSTLRRDELVDLLRYLTTLGKADQKIK